MPTLSPAQDSAIAHKYDAKSLQEKVQNKLALQRELGWPAEAKCPVICLPAGMSEELGGGLLKTVLPGLLTLPVQILIRGKGSATYGTLFAQLEKRHPHRISIIPNTDEAVRGMLAAADMALFLADPSDLPELGYCLSYGTVPLAPLTGKLENYDPNQERGTGFLFEESTPWHVFGAAVRALETYRFPFDWRTIQRQCMEAA